jgi:hypothetical protein
MDVQGYIGGNSCSGRLAAFGATNADVVRHAVTVGDVMVRSPWETKSIPLTIN